VQKEKSGDFGDLYRLRMNKFMSTEQIKQASQEYKEIYKQEYGVELSDTEANQQSLMLLQLFDSLTS
jgi:hypothetical protein